MGKLMKQRAINLGTNFIAKRLVKVILIALFNFIGITSVIGIPIVVIVDMIFLFMLIQTFYGYSIVGGRFLIRGLGVIWRVLKYLSLILIILIILSAIYQLATYYLF